MKKLAILGCLTSLTSIAYADDFTAGEMNTAGIIENNDILITPNFQPSQIGVTDKLALGTFLLGNVGGILNLGAKYGIIQNDESMLSATAFFGYELAWEDEDTGESGGGAPWVFTALDYSMMVGDNWLSFNGGIGITTENSEVSVGGSNLAATYLMLNGDKAWEFELWANPYGMTVDGAEIADNVGARAQWFKSINFFRFGLGIEVQGTSSFTSSVPDFIVDLLSDYELPVIANPNVYLGARF